MSTSLQQGFPPSADLTSDTLYRYQPYNATHLEGTIVGNSIRFSDHRRINDPWDCAPNMRRDLLEDSVIRQRYFEILYDKALHMRKSDEQARKMANHFLATPEARADFLKLGTSSLVDSHKHTRIYCLSTRHDSTLMWSHYAERHSGVCLGFHWSTSSTFNRACPVEYAESYPTIDPYGQDSAKLAHQILCVKSHDWAYECEYRLLASEGGDIEGVLPVNDGFLTIDETDLRVIILGCNIDAGAAETVRSLARQRTRSLPIVRAIKSPDRYELEFVEDHAA